MRRSDLLEACPGAFASTPGGDHESQNRHRRRSPSLDEQEWRKHGRSRAVDGCSIAKGELPGRKKRERRQMMTIVREGRGGLFKDDAQPGTCDSAGGVEKVKELSPRPRDHTDVLLRGSAMVPQNYVQLTARSTPRWSAVRRLKSTIDVRTIR